MPSSMRTRTFFAALAYCAVKVLRRVRVVASIVLNEAVMGALMTTLGAEKLTFDNVVGAPEVQSQGASLASTRSTVTVLV